MKRSRLISSTLKLSTSEHRFFCKVGWKYSLVGEETLLIDDWILSEYISCTVNSGFIPIFLEIRTNFAPSNQIQTLRNNSFFEHNISLIETFRHGIQNQLLNESVCVVGEELSEQSFVFIAWFAVNFPTHFTGEFTEEITILEQTIVIMLVHKIEIMKKTKLKMGGRLDQVIQ